MSVYFAHAGDYVKVGYSANPLDRVSSVTRLGVRPADLAKGADAHLLGWVPGDRSRERELHAKFADRRVAGEWFALDVAEVRDLIWADPSGVDLERMSAVAVFVAHRQPELTREDIAAAGVRVEAPPLDESLALMNSWLSGGAA